MSVESAFTFHPLSIPFIVLSLGLVAVMLCVAMIRGDSRLSRGALALALPALVWSGGHALAMNVSTETMIADNGQIVGRYEPVALWCLRVGQAAVPLIGAAWLNLFVALGYDTARQRRAVAVLAVAGAFAVGAGIASGIAVADVWITPWGIWQARAGPFAPAYVALMLIGGIAAMIAAQGRWQDERTRGQLRRMSIIFALIVLAASDVLVIYELGVYPFSFIPVGVAIALGLLGIVKRDVLRSRGINRVAAWEVAVGLALVPVCTAGAWLASRAPEGDRTGAGVLLCAGLLVVFALAQLLLQWIARHDRAHRHRVTSRADQVLEEYSEFSLENRDDGQLATVLSSVLEEFAALSEIRLLIADAGNKLRLAGARKSYAVELPAPLWELFRANPSPVFQMELSVRHLDTLRPVIAGLLSDLAADVLVPLVDRERLVGAIAAAGPPGGRALRDEESLVLAQTARVTAKALTFIGLYHEAEARVAIAKEVEVAAAVQQAQTPGEDRRRFAICEVTSHYTPGAHFGGDWWITRELSDDRVLVVMGDISGHGVPAALVSSTVLGACETAIHLLGDRIDVLALMELLNEAVLAVGETSYSMSCFAALFDMERRVVSFSNAGYRFPYVCRPSDDPNRAQLGSLIARGTCLGTEDPVLTQVSQPIADDDVVVFYSDALVQTADPAGRPYGERRLQRVLQHHALRARSRACQVIVEDARAHYGPRPIADDITLVVVRIGREGERADASA